VKPAASLGARLWAYQKERFPVWFTLPLALGICLSAVAYSRLSSGQTGFIGWDRFALGFYTSAVLFFLLRVLDEHKDQDIDRRWRPELPVPRGLVSLAELRAVIGALAGVALILNAWLMPAMLPLLLVAAAWAALMGVEFFVPQWLKAHPMAYLHSHMLFLPAMDFYSTGLDWRLEGRAPGFSLLLFLAVTYLNGLVVEFGRKLRTPEQEREGVDTYSKLWGVPKAVRLWMLSVGLAAMMAVAAGSQAQAGPLRLVLLAVVLLAVLWQGWAFLREPSPVGAKRVETLSGVWTLFTYFWLGLGPFLLA
jgi:4-hydroxybenzoate polyprenyltransferase